MAVTSEREPTQPHHDRPSRLPRSADYLREDYAVESGLELLTAGMTLDEVLADYPDSERDDVLAALEFGARAARWEARDRPPGRGGRTPPGSS